MKHVFFMGDYLFTSFVSKVSSKKKKKAVAATSDLASSSAIQGCGSCWSPAQSATAAKSAAVTLSEIPSSYEYTCCNFICN